MENKEQFIFTAEDIFEEIPGDPENVMMKFPDEVLKLTGWKEGDVLDIEVKDGKIVVTKHE
jgi:hypothetical protein